MHLCPWSSTSMEVSSSRAFLSNPYLVSANNDREVASKSFAWRLLGVLPTLKKEAAINETDEWRAERRARLYHACIGESVLD